MKNLFLSIIIILVLFNCFINGFLNENLKSDKGIIAKKIEKDKPFFGLFAIPYIICFFAAKGFWPPYPYFMHRKVDEMGRYVFSMDDNGIRNFCAGIMPINFCFRPFGFKGYLLSKFFCFNNTVTTTTEPEVETIRPTEPPTDPPTEPPTDPPTTTTTTTTTICACAQPQKLQIENTTQQYSLTHILLHTTPQPRRILSRTSTQIPQKKSVTGKPYSHLLKIGDTTIGVNTGGVISTSTDNRTHFPPFPVRIRPFRSQVNPSYWWYTTRLPATRQTTRRRTSPFITASPTQLTTTTQSTTTTSVIDVDDETTTPPTTTDDIEILSTTTEFTDDVLERIIDKSEKWKRVTPGKQNKGKPVKKMKN